MLVTTRSTPSDLKVLPAIYITLMQSLINPTYSLGYILALRLAGVNLSSLLRQVNRISFFTTGSISCVRTSQLSKLYCTNPLRGVDNVNAIALKLSLFLSHLLTDEVDMITMLTNNRNR